MKLINLPGLSAFDANGIASHGDGKSRNTASAAALSVPKPSEHTSRCETVTSSVKPCEMNSSRALFTRSSWKSNVCRWPVGAIVRKIACDNDALPVPDKRCSDKNKQ